MDAVIITHVFTVTIMSWEVSGYACPRDGIPTVDMCMSMTLTAKTFLLDFTTFQSFPARACTCDVVVNIAFYLEVQLSPISPDQDCGTMVTYGPFMEYNISVRKDTLQYKRSQCQESKQVKSRDVEFGQKFTVSIERISPSYFSNYCMKAEVDAWNGSMTIQCQDPRFQNETETTTEALILTEAVGPKCNLEPVTYGVGGVLTITVVCTLGMSTLLIKRRAMLKATESVYMSIVSPWLQRQALTSVSSDRYISDSRVTEQVNQQTTETENVYDEIQCDPLYVVQL